MMDANEAVARIAYKINEVCIIFPITPASPIGEHADLWSSQGVKNAWGHVVDVYEMQSEGGAAGAVHGALQTGALATTFTSSQGLLLMIPNMYKIAGELTSAVFHVAARSLAAQALSIFGDQSDVMSTRSTGFSMLCSSDVQGAQDFALISHAATLKSRVPITHFFDGFRTSHEVNKIAMISEEHMLEMIDQDLVEAHRKRALNPDNPFIRGTAQNPDVYFQARETVNPFYNATPEIIQDYMDRFAGITGRQYHLCEYSGAEDADRVIIIMGSGASAVQDAIDYLQDETGDKLGVLNIHLYRPFPSKLIAALLPDTVKSIAVLDRTKEPGAEGEPLYKDVVTALSEAFAGGEIESMPRIIGGRYGLSSKEFTPSMIKAIFEELGKDQPKNHFTIGINDDICGTSIAYDHDFHIEKDEVTRAIFFGLGSDGTVGANKNSIKIIGELPDKHAQGYFVYDSKKAGSQTISHLRFGPDPIDSPYLIQSANFIACHQYNFIYKINILKSAAPGATFLLNSPHSEEEIWEKLPVEMQKVIIEKELTFYVINAYDVARETGMGVRINTIMQTCFFAIAGILPRDEAITKIKEMIHKSFIKKGAEVVQKNYDAVEHTLGNLHQVDVPDEIRGDENIHPPVSPDAPEFVRKVLGEIIAGRGDDLPVSAMPIDGTYPVGSAAWDTRDITEEVPIWEPDLCVQCGNCEIVCPHAVIRMKSYDESLLADAPEGFKSERLKGRDIAANDGRRYTLQIAVENCTGCTLCVAACPVDPVNELKPINMAVKEPILEQEKASWAFFKTLPEFGQSEVEKQRVKDNQYLTPTFEFSGACAGCGETPYLKMITQLFGEYSLVANATGCSSIFGGNLPSTPWSKTGTGRGAAWSNSLFEDNAEFGLGFKIAIDKLNRDAIALLEELSEDVGSELADQILHAQQETGAGVNAQRDRITELKGILGKMDSARAKELAAVADYLLRKVVWIIGGDGWAYDIGFGGLDHVIASDKNVNILVMDTEVYSNTGGQQSKATPRAATAKFASGGKTVAKKDLGMIAMTYGHAYVAQIAFGSNPKQSMKAIQEAVSYDGPSLVIAYATCIAQGIDLCNTVTQMRAAVDSAYWPLYRFDPRLKELGRNPMQLDSGPASISFADYAKNENRYNQLSKMNPENAASLMALAQQDVNDKWQLYTELARRI